MNQQTAIATLWIGLCLFTQTIAPRTAIAADEATKAALNRMVDDEVVATGIKSPHVIASMHPRRTEFTPPDQRKFAYYDMAVPLGHGQSVSPPFVVAYMTEQLDPQANEKVLEVGTGSGYQAAVLSPLVKDVYTIEIKEPLGKQAAETLKRLGYANVHTRIGDGYKGWPEAAPFDRIIVTCSPEEVPQALVDQLRKGGRLIIPVGERFQQTLYRFDKVGGKLKAQPLEGTMFVPMTGQAERDAKCCPTVANQCCWEATSKNSRRGRIAGALVLLSPWQNYGRPNRAGWKACADVRERRARSEREGITGLCRRRPRGFAIGRDVEGPRQKGESRHRSGADPALCRLFFQ